MLTPETADQMLQGGRPRNGGTTAESSIVYRDVDAIRLSRTGSFESFIRWMCQRSAYLAFAESTLTYDPPPDDYLRDVFGWVECATRSQVSYASGSLIWWYVVPCHAGQYVPLLSLMNGLCDFVDGCPVDNLALFDAEGFPRLRTITHEGLAWLTVTQQELQEATSSRQSWLQVLDA